MRIQYLFILLFGLAIAACNQPRVNHSNSTNIDIAAISEEPGVPLTVADLLSNAVQPDTLQYDNWQPFVFFKACHFLNTTDKYALAVTAQTDSTMLVELYTFKNAGWILHASVENLDGPGMSFQPVFADYNFDGQTDIYIQTTVSNGYSLSRGHLIIVDPLKMKLQHHPEAQELANMKPDAKTRTVMSDEVIECRSTMMKDVGIWTNKWVNGQLKTVNKNYPCDPLK